MNKQRIILFLLLSAALWGLPRRASAQIFAVRANALAACSATLNVGAETALTDNWSLELSGYWNPVYDEKKATEEAYEANLTKEIIPSYWIDLDKIDTFSDTNTAIKDFFEQQQAQFVCGELDIDNDADWQAYVDGMYSLGLEDWVATQGIEEIAK